VSHQITEDGHVVIHGSAAAAVPRISISEAAAGAEAAAACLACPDDEMKDLPPRSREPPNNWSPPDDLRDHRRFTDAAIRSPGTLLSLLAPWHAV